jgi:hypothetical protein
MLAGKVILQLRDFSEQVFIKQAGVIKIKKQRLA